MSVTIENEQQPLVYGLLSYPELLHQSVLELKEMVKRDDIEWLLSIQFFSLVEEEDRARFYKKYEVDQSKLDRYWFVVVIELAKEYHLDAQKDEPIIPFEQIPGLLRKKRAQKDLAEKQWQMLYDLFKLANANSDLYRQPR